MIALLVLAGCVTERIESPSRRGVADPQRPVAVRTAPTSAYSFKTVFAPIGAVPYDRATLPLVSPDGRYVATQTGAPPDAATQQAEASAMIPYGSKVEVYRLLDPPAPEGSSLVKHVKTLETPLILGRSANERGFIVEAPQASGARWIGFVEWSTGALTWLVQDENVNAFAALGSRASTDLLAWSRRTVDGLNFELIVRRGAEYWTFPEENVDLLYPTWAGRGEGVFCLELRPLNDDVNKVILSVVYMYGATEAQMKQTRRAIRISNFGDADMAYQTMAPFAATVGAPQPASPMLLFYHGEPAFQSVAVWRPFERGRNATKLLEAGSVAGVIDQEWWAIYSFSDEVVSRPLDEDGPRIKISDEFWAPRLTTNPNWRILLMAPFRDQPWMTLMGVQAAGQIEYTDN